MHLYLALALLLPGMLHGAADSDAVNERIPVSPKQLEAHWDIDCSASWASLTAGACPPAADLSRVLQLCAAIYQRPGDDRSSNCPDYLAAGQAAARGDCHQLRQAIAAARECPLANGETAPANRAPRPAAGD